jgi:predicted TIM-barrel fold metal-dependent hydrolase
MRIDSHLHLNFKNIRTGGDIVAYLDRHNLEKCWLLTWEELHPAIPCEYRHLSARDVCDAYRAYPSRIVPMYAPDPATPDLEQKIADCYSQGIRGLGELKVSLNWDSPLIERFLVAAARYHLPVVFHMEEPGYFPFRHHSLNRIFNATLNRNNRIGRFLASDIRTRSGYFPGYLPDFHSLEERLGQFPDVPFIGHGQLFWKGIAGGERDDAPYPHRPVRQPGILSDLLYRHDNLFADLSGRSAYNALSRDLPYARQFVSEFSHKLLFGTDNGSYGIGDLLSGLQLGQGAMDRIMGQNATRILEQQERYR